MNWIVGHLQSALVTIQEGGVMMYPILLCSVVALAVALERFYHLRRSRIMPESLLKEVRACKGEDCVDHLYHLCSHYAQVPIARILKVAIETRFSDRAKMEQAIENAGRQEAALMASKLRVLGVIANLAPMMGLLGTVLGMIHAFTTIAQVGTGQPSLVARGISEALITTAAGLIVAIPCLALYHYLKAKVERYAVEMEEVVDAFLNRVLEEAR